MLSAPLLRPLCSLRIALKALLPTALLCSLLLAATAAPAAAEPLRVVAGTSLIEDIVRDLTGGKSEILTLTQGSSCPGHENAKTGDFLFTARARLLLIHGFQRDMPQLKNMLEAVDNPRLQRVELQGRGSWLVPENQKKAVMEIAAALSAVAPDKAHDFARRAEARLRKVDEAERESLALLAPVRGKAVAAARMQAEFATWAGLNVVRTYGRGEDLSAGDLAGLVDALRTMSVSGVIDNRQSGPEVGLPLALELKIPHLTLSNFPGSGPDVPDYFSLLRVNTALLAGL